MKKIIVLFALCLFFVGLNTTNAQVKAVINGGVQIPTGDFKNGSDVGYGGSIDAEFSLPMVGPTIFASVGYNRWGIKNTSFSLYAIPMLGGLKYFFTAPGSPVVLYVGGGLGVVVLNDNTPFSTTESKFIWAPVVGLRFGGFDVNAKYQSFSSGGTTFNWFGINAGIAVGN